MDSLACLSRKVKIYQKNKLKKYKCKRALETIQLCLDKLFEVILDAILRLQQDDE